MENLISLIVFIVIVVFNLLSASNNEKKKKEEKEFGGSSIEDQLDRYLRQLEKEGLDDKNTMTVDEAFGEEAYEPIAERSYDREIRPRSVLGKKQEEPESFIPDEWSEIDEDYSGGIKEAMQDAQEHIDNVQKHREAIMARKLQDRKTKKKKKKVVVDEEFEFNARDAIIYDVIMRRKY